MAQNGEETTVRSGRLPNDLDEAFVEYRDEKGISTSEAVRYLTRAGLEAEREDDQEDDVDEVRSPTTGPVTQVAGGVLALTLPMSTAAVVALFLDVGADVTLPVLAAGVFWMAASAVAIVAGTTRKLDQLLADRMARDLEDDQEENGNGNGALATDGGVEA